MGYGGLIVGSILGFMIGELVSNLLLKMQLVLKHTVMAIAY